MPEFFILNDVPAVNAANARQAARQYAIAQGIEGGTVTVATGTKTFDVQRVPSDIEVTES